MLSKSFRLLLLLQRPKLVSRAKFSVLKTSLVVVIIVVGVDHVLDVHDSADGNGRKGHELKWGNGGRLWTFFFFIVSLFSRDNKLWKKGLFS